MGNLISLHNNDVNRLYRILRFLAKKVTVISNFGDRIYEKADLEQCAEYIIDNAPYEEFRGLIIEKYSDLIQDLDKSFDQSLTEAEITIGSHFDTKMLNLTLDKLRIYGYEKDYKFFASENTIMLSFSLLALEYPDAEADRIHLNLMKLRDKWVRERRLDYTSGVGAFGIIL